MPELEEELDKLASKRKSVPCCRRCISEGQNMAISQTTGIIGAGQMGSGIAHVCAGGYQVLLNDVSQERIEAGIATISGNLARQTASGRVEETARDAALSVLLAASLNTMENADLVIEAARK